LTLFRDAIDEDNDEEEEDPGFASAGNDGANERVGPGQADDVALDVMPNNDDSLVNDDSFADPALDISVEDTGHDADGAGTPQRVRAGARVFARGDGRALAALAARRAIGAAFISALASRVITIARVGIFAKEFSRLRADGARVDIPRRTRRAGCPRLRRCSRRRRGTRATTTWTSSRIQATRKARDHR
jgi:hypothetical protein